MKTLVASAEPPRPPQRMVPWTISVPAQLHRNVLIRWLSSLARAASE